MLVIPLQPVPSQSVSVQLADQACQINVYQKSTGLYLDLYVAGTLIVAGVICQNQNRIVRSAYLGFAGDLMFGDNQGTSDPDYTGLGAQGARFSLVYIEPEPVPQVTASFIAQTFPPLAALFCNSTTVFCNSTMAIA